MEMGKTMNLALAADTLLDKEIADAHRRDAELIAWAERLAMLGQGKSVPELIVRLRQLVESGIDTETRYRILRAVKRPLLQVAAATAKLPHRGDGLSLVQRLYGAMADNLHRLLEDIDHQRHGVSDERLEQRDWTVRNLIRFMQRELLHSVSAGTAWPPGVWQKFHDLFVYLVFRGNVRLHDHRDDCEAEHAYKWMLLIGLATERLGFKAMNADLFERLDDVVGECRLIDSDGTVGEYGLILVEVGRDHPARLQDGALDDSFRGWVLRGPESLIALLCGAVLD
jgi:hypothetical protein